MAIDEAPCREERHMMERVSNLRAGSLPFLIPKLGHVACESALVADVLLMIQGFESDNLIWDQEREGFTIRKGLRFAQISHASFHKLLDPFLSAATSLRKLDLLVKGRSYARFNDADTLAVQSCPTLQAFINVVSMRLQFFRKAALDKELEFANRLAGESRVTLLSIASSLSWVCAGAVFLEHAVDAALPDASTFSGKSAADLASNILTTLYTEMNNFCLVRDGGEQAYGTLLLLFVGSLQPLLGSLDTWIREGILNDPAGELFFYADSSVTVENDAFWLHGYMLRSRGGAGVCSQQTTHTIMNLRKTSSVACGTFPSSAPEILRPEGRSEQKKSIRTPSFCANDAQDLACPAFLQPFARAIVSAGKSLQILHFICRQWPEASDDSCQLNEGQVGEAWRGSKTCSPWGTSANRVCTERGHLKQPIISSSLSSKTKPYHVQAGCLGIASPKLCLSLSLFEQLILSLGKFIGEDTFKAVRTLVSISSSSDMKWKRTPETMWPPLTSEQHLGRESESAVLARREQLPRSEKQTVWDKIPVKVADGEKFQCSAAQCGRVLTQPSEVAATLGKIYASNVSMGADYGFGKVCGRILSDDGVEDWQDVKPLLASQTRLPSWQGTMLVSQSIPAKMQIRLTAGVLEWLQDAVFETFPSPAVLVQECLATHLDQQVQAVSQELLQQLMGEWHLMEELALLRTIYLVGSGDLLQQFSTVLFNKLDRGELWDDYYELNSVLQESIRNSVNEAALSAWDSLAVVIKAPLKTPGNTTTSPVSSHLFGQNSTYGIDALESMRFVYKVAWPLELIIDANAIMKYNQVMAFLMKVKRAKHVLDKACRFTWKNGGGHAAYDKRRFLLQHKLMHFVNALHQYVMDRVLYSAWVELCEGMSMARSLDEVIMCHDAYLVSIQRQCLVAPDRLWTLIASRVKNILALALDYYVVQCTLCDGVTAPAMSIKCQSEIERISKQFDECMLFLLRVLSFKLNIGQFPHLADLITRMNYNFYYMSEHGHLLTPFPDLHHQNVRPSSASRAEVIGHRSGGRGM